MRKIIFFAPEIVAGISRWALFWRGLFILLIGILICVHPLLATLAFGAIIGCGLIFSGIWIIAGAFQTGIRSWAWLIYGLLLACGGVLLLANPGAELLAAAWSVAVLMLSCGVIGITSCVAQHPTSGQNIWCFISWICSILLGILLFIFPLAGLAEIFWMLGILLGLEGIGLMIFAFRISEASSVSGR